MAEAAHSLCVKETEILINGFFHPFQKLAENVRLVYLLTLFDSIIYSLYSTLISLNQFHV